MNKGGCKIGRKKEPKGGCKIGKKNPETTKTSKQLEDETTKKKIEKPKAKKVKAKAKAKMPKTLRIKETVATGVNRSKAEKKARIVAKVLKLGKEQVAKKQKTKKDYTAPKKLRTELLDSFGLTNAEANKMDPTKLFGMLPPEIGQMILTPSLRGGGVQVARHPLSTDADFKEVFQKIYKLRVKRGNVNSKAAIKDITDMVNSFYREVLKKRIKRGRRYTEFNILEDLQRSGKLEAGRKYLLADFEKAKVNFAERDAEKAKAKTAGIEYDADEVKRRFKVGQLLIGQSRFIDSGDATRKGKFLAKPNFTIVKFTPKGVSIKSKEGKITSISYKVFRNRFSNN